MNFKLSYIIQGFKLKTFEELSSYTHDIELSITTNGGQTIPIQSPYNGCKNHKSKNMGKPLMKYKKIDTMNVNFQLFKIFTKNTRKFKHALELSSDSRRLYIILKKDNKNNIHSLILMSL